MNHQTSLIYIWDAYCGWCYGFSNSLRTFHENHPELPITVLSGGLFTGNRSLPIESYPHIPEANERISQLTGVTYGEAYQNLLNEGSFVLDSEAAAVGFSALRALAPEQSLSIASAMQKAFYQDGKSLSDTSTYLEIADSFGLDSELISQRLKDEDIRKDAHEDFTRVQNLDVHSYPTLLLRKGNELLPLGGGAMTAEKLESRLALYLSKTN